MGLPPTVKPRVVVLVCAMSEWRAVKEVLVPGELQRSALGDWFNSKTGVEEVIYFHSGWGKIAAAAGTQFLIDTFSPGVLINLGTCGGLEGRIARGTILLVNRTIIYDIIEQMSDAQDAIDHYSTELDLDWLPPEETWYPVDREYPLIRGLLVSADRDILASDIPMLINQYNAEAADWESGAIAWVSRKNKVRCLILRGVTDLVGAGGGEAYGKIEVFHENTRLVMKRLIGMLPGLIAKV